MGYTADISMFPYFKNKEGEFKDEDGLISKIMIVKMIEKEIEDGVIKEQIGIEDVIENLEKQNTKLQDMLVEKCKMETQNGKQMLKEMEEKIKLQEELEKIKMENVSLNEFKEKAEIECDASAVADVFMNEIEELKNQVDKLKKKAEIEESRYEIQKKVVDDIGELVFKFITNEKPNFIRQCVYIEDTMMKYNDFDTIVELMKVSICRDIYDEPATAFELYDDDDFDEFIEWEDEDEFNLFAEDCDLDVRYDNVGEDLYEYKDDYIDWVCLKNKIGHYRIERGLGASLYIVR
jgi:polyhydroxyalkanoate synthesis regulator phasin